VERAWTCVLLVVLPFVTEIAFFGNFCVMWLTISITGNKVGVKEHLKHVRENLSEISISVRESKTIRKTKNKEKHTISGT
jgi:hypothetical protein